MSIDLKAIEMVMDIRVNLVNARTNLRAACRSLGLSDDDASAPDAPAQVALLADRIARHVAGPSPAVLPETQKASE